METNNSPKLASELITFIKKSNAHVSFDDAVRDIPTQFRTAIPVDLPYSIWQMIEHMRIAQKDIVEFSTSDSYKELNWPDDYWVKNPEQVSDADWNKALEAIKKDQSTFFDLLQNEETDLFQPFAWGKGQTLFKEALLIADHNAYHTAEIVVIRRLLKCWK